MIQGIIDIGSNTVRMAIYEIENGAMELILKSIWWDWQPILMTIL